MTASMSQPPKTGNQRRVSPYLFIWVGVVVLFVLALIVTPNAVSLDSVGSMLPYLGILAIAAVGQTMVVLQRGIDFSVPGAIVVSGIVMADLTGSGWSLAPAVLATLCLGLGVGLINGLVVVRLSLTPLVATLASNGIYIAIALMISGGFPVSASSELISTARKTLAGVSVSFWLGLLFLLVLVFLLNKTVAGRRFVAVGANPLTARVSGVHVKSYIVLAYCTSGICYAVAGMLIAGYVGSARIEMGDTYLIASIAAVVIGGTPLTGGRGSLVASVGGAAFLTLLTQMVLALGAPTSVQLFVQAVVLVVAVALPNAISLIKSGIARERLQAR